MKLRAANIVGALIILAGALFVFFTLARIKYKVNADEGFYFTYASYIAEKGVGGFAFLAKAYLGIKDWIAFPSPLRVGYIVPIALWLKIFGPSYVMLSLFSLFAYVVLLILFFMFVKRYFGRKIAVWSLLLCVSSPLQMAMARRVLVESFVSIWLFAALWSFFEYIKSKKSSFALFFVFTLSMAIAIKEPYSVLIAVFLFYFFIHTRVFASPVRWKDILPVLLYPLIICGICYFFIVGDIVILKRVMKQFILPLHQPLTGYALVYTSGPWFKYLLDFFILSPWVMILSIAYFFEYLTRRQWKESIFYVLFAGFLSFCALSCLQLKAMRYLLFIDPFLRLAAVLMLIRLIRRFGGRYWELILWGALLSIVVIDLCTFYTVFIDNQIYDPVTVNLLQALHLIPGN